MSTSWSLKDCKEIVLNVVDVVRSLRDCQWVVVDVVDVVLPIMCSTAASKLDREDSRSDQFLKLLLRCFCLSMLHRLMGVVMTAFTVR